MDKLMSELKDPQQSMLTSQTNIWHTYALSMTKDLFVDYSLFWYRIVMIANELLYVIDRGYVILSHPFRFLPSCRFNLI